MDISSDYRDLFNTFNRYKVRYLVVGAYALIYYAEPRFTKDMDIWVKTDARNAERVYRALKKFGAPLKGIRPEDFMNERMIYQIGVAPVRIDVLMGLSGIQFDAAWKKRVRSKYGDVPVSILGVKDLIRAKRRAGRPQDRVDVEKLTMTSKRASSRRKRK